ncbi:MAG: IS481 family transposase [Desulfobacterales bacterium]|nr:IS481 family transposase [Desulfobacterales bacterium]
MIDDIQQQRTWGVQRFLNGEKPESVCASLGCSRAWLYKWVKRFVEGDPFWVESRSQRPLITPTRTPLEIEEIIKLVRLNLYNRDLFCGAQAIRWEMEELNVQPLPSIRTIDRILSRQGLTHRRIGRYESKGKAYPKLPSLLPNQTHQADWVGPCYLTSPLRFYSLNVVDTATGRCGLQPSVSKAGQQVIDTLWAIWKRLGIPDNLQVDNEMSFFGSPIHPRGMGPLIRLCLHQGVEPWFIPMAEPWRNGVVEKFNDHYEQRFLQKVPMATVPDLLSGSLAYEQKHNSTYRYSKLGGKTPLKALEVANRKLRFPKKEQSPQHRLKKPETGRYHLVRFIRSNLKLNIFGEMFPMPPELEYQYVVATIDVKEQNLKLYLDKTEQLMFNYILR